MKYYIIAGEASGDLHGSNLMKCIKKTVLQISVLGGDLKATGGTLVNT
jgi:lipid-A-disaccharide synthase